MLRPSRAGRPVISKTQDQKTKTDLTLRVLDSLSRTPIHTARNWSKADVYLVEWPPDSGVQVVVKDLRRCPLWFRISMGRSFMRREWKALRVLDGTRGVPCAVAKPSVDVLVIEYLAGSALKNLKPKHYPREATLQLEELVRALHARGVTHGDLHDSNILIEQNESGVQVFLIDWATALVWKLHRSAAQQRLFREFRSLDLRSIAKMKLFYDRDHLGEDEMQLLEKGGSTLYRGVKNVRRRFDKMRGKQSKGTLERRLERVRKRRQKSVESQTTASVTTQNNENLT